MNKLRLYFTSRRLLKRQLQEALEEKERLEKTYELSAAVVTHLRDERLYRREQLHRVARERDKERRLRLEAEDMLFKHIVDNEE